MSSPLLDDQEVRTEVNLATWNHWPEAPAGDIARLIPSSHRARTAFKRVVQAMQKDDEDRVPQFARPFIHFEATEDRYAAVEDSASEAEGQRQKSHEILPAVTGYYRVVKAESPLQTEWLFGCGRSDKSVSFILDFKRGMNAIHGQNGRLIERDGNILLVSDRHELQIVGVGKLLARKTKQREDSTELERSMYQRRLRSGNIIQVGFLEYRFEIPGPTGNSSTNDDSSNAYIPALMTPTPKPDLSTFRGYEFSPAFDAGARGAVFICTSSATAKVFACKRITTTNPKQHKNALREVNLLQQCLHKHIVRLHEHIAPEAPNILGRPESRVREHFLIMEPVLRINLRHFILSLAGSMYASERSAEAQKMLTQLASAVSYLHDEKSIMHRDIKPDNIGVEDRGQDKVYYLFDFDHAGQCKSSEDHMKGTLRYLAKEVLDLKHGRRSQPYDFAVDVFSLGVTAAEHIMGILTCDETHTLRFREELDYYEEQSLPSRFKRLVLSMMNTDPSKRPKMQSVSRYQEVVESSKRGRFSRQLFAEDSADHISTSYCDDSPARVEP